MEARVTFSVLAHTDFGDSVLMVGNCPSLGCWDPTKGALLSTDNGSYPHWRSSPLFFSQEVVEYKYVRRRSNGDIVWENCGARNRQAIVEKNKEYLVNDKMDVENSTEVKLIPTVVNVQPIVIPAANPVIEVVLSPDPISKSVNETKVEENVVEYDFAESIPIIEEKKENNNVSSAIPVDKVVQKSDSNLMSNDSTPLKFFHPLSLSEPTIHQLSSKYYKSSKSESEVPLVPSDDEDLSEDKLGYLPIPNTPNSPKSKSPAKTYTPVIHQKFSKSYPFLHAHTDGMVEYSPQKSLSTSNISRHSNGSLRAKQKEVLDCELPVVDFKEYQFPDRYMIRITEQSGLTKLSSQIADVNILIVQDYSKSNFTTEQEMNQHMADYENFPMSRIWQVKYFPKPITIYIPFSKENVSVILKAIAFTPKHELDKEIPNVLDAARLLYPGLTKINDKANPLLWKAKYTASFICLDPHFIHNGFGPQGFPEIQNTLPQMFYDRYGITPPKIVQEKGKYRISFFTVYCCWKKGPSFKCIGNPLLAAPPYELHYVSVVVGPQYNFQVVEDKLLDQVVGNPDWWPEPSLYGKEQGYPAYGPKPELGAGDHLYQVFNDNNNHMIKSRPGN